MILAGLVVYVLGAVFLKFKTVQKVVLCPFAKYFSTEYTSESIVVHFYTSLQSFTI